MDNFVVDMQFNYSIYNDAFNKSLYPSETSTVCPCSDKVKYPEYDVKDEQSGMNVSRYRITDPSGNVWLGEDPFELGKDGKAVSVQFESFYFKNNTMYCDYQLKVGDALSGVRLTLEN